MASKAADHVTDTFCEGGRVGIDGHPEIEVALVGLYRELGDDRYLEQARPFIDQGGRGLLADVEFGPAL